MCAESNPAEQTMRNCSWPYGSTSLPDVHTQASNGKKRQSCDLDIAVPSLSVNFISRTVVPYALTVRGPLMRAFVVTRKGAYFFAPAGSLGSAVAIGWPPQ